jgi:hypothetical protein
MNTLQQLRQYVDGLGRRSTPHYGQLLLLIVLSLALWIGHSRISEVDRSIRGGIARVGQVAWSSPDYDGRIHLNRGMPTVRFLFRKQRVFCCAS